MTETTPKPLLETSPPQARRFGRFNGMGLRTLYVKEVKRFMKVRIALFNSSPRVW